MKTSIAASLAGLAFATGLATAASVTIHFDLDDDPLSGSTAQPVDGVYTWTVYASFTGYPDASAYFGGYVGSFAPSSDALLDSVAVSNLTNLMEGSGTDAAAEGGRVGSINIFNSALLGTDDPSNPLAIFSFDMEITGPLTDWLSYTTEDGVASVFPDSGIFALPDEYSGDEIFVISDVIIPVPGTGLLIGGGMLAMRRNRSA